MSLGKPKQKLSEQKANMWLNGGEILMRDLKTADVCKPNFRMVKK